MANRNWFVSNATIESRIELIRDLFAVTPQLLKEFLRGWLCLTALFQTDTVICRDPLQYFARSHSAVQAVFDQSRNHLRHRPILPARLQLNSFVFVSRNLNLDRYCAGVHS